MSPTITKNILRSTALALALSATQPVAAQANNRDAAASDAFAKIIERHRTAPALDIHSTITITLENGGIEESSEEVTARFVRTQDNHGLLDVAGYTVHLQGKEIFIVHESNADEYFRGPLVEGETWLHPIIVYEVFGGFARVPFPHLALLWGADQVNDVCMELYVDTPGLIPTGLIDRVVDGNTLRAIVFADQNGTTLELLYDPATLNVLASEQTIKPGVITPDGITRINRWSNTYQENAPAAADIAFAQGDRQRVDSLFTLAKSEQPEVPEDFEDPGNIAPAVGRLVGKPAPPLSLPTNEGALIDLATLRGQVVVIDFWAEWCPPCRRALPELHDVAAWAVEGRLPVVVYTINTFENGRTNEDKLKTATAFWAESGHTLPMLMDFDNAAAAAWGVSGIPATFVIGPDGVVVAQHSGFGPNYADELKNEITEAVEGD
ncbi:MAG: TlpA family protein disulfide reductase [Phycisphaerales bacterium]